MLLDCIGKDITSKELGDFAYEAWFYFTEGKGANEKAEKQFLDILLELSSEWGFISATNSDEQFPKEYLENVLQRIEKFMNIEEEGIIEC